MNEERRNEHRSEHRSEVERAAEVQKVVQHRIDHMMKLRGTTLAADIAAALSAAGLLRTDADRRCVEACVSAHATPAGTDLTSSPALLRWYECCDAGRAILDSRKPKERWTVKKGLSEWWVHEDNVNTGQLFPADAEPEARAYVDRKNAEEAK